MNKTLKFASPWVWITVSVQGSYGFGRQPRLASSQHLHPTKHFWWAEWSYPRIFRLNGTNLRRTWVAHTGKSVIHLSLRLSLITNNTVWAPSSSDQLCWKEWDSLENLAFTWSSVYSGFYHIYFLFRPYVTVFGMCLYYSLFLSLSLPPPPLFKINI